MAVTVLKKGSLALVGFAVHLLAHLGEELEVVRGARNEHFFGLVDRQAGVGGFHRGNVRYVLVNQIPQATHQARALLHRQVGPFRKRLFGGGNGLMDFGFAA